jgi:hypothetical protein
MKLAQSAVFQVELENLFKKYNLVPKLTDPGSMLWTVYDERGHLTVYGSVTFKQGPSAA